MKHLKKLSLALLGLTIMSGSAIGSEWPSKPIELVFTGAAGGSTDAVWRVISESVSKTLGQQVVPNYKPGAAGNIAGLYTVQQPADGYTFMITTIHTHSIAPNIFKNLRYDPIEDLKGVARLVILPNVLYVNNNLPVNSVTDLVEYAKANPKKVNYASSGIGASTHMSSVLFSLETDIEMEHVPYAGSAPAVQGMLSGEADISFENLSAVMPHIQAGSMKALAVTTQDRWKGLPDTPTVDEAGVPGFDVTSWFGIVAPRDVPDDIVARFADAVRIALENPEVAEKMNVVGAEPAYLPPEEMETLLRTEVTRWAPVVEASGVEIE